MGDGDTEPAPNLDDLQAELDGVREDLREFEDDVDRRTVERDALEAELKRYVRRRQRRGHAQGWGPYLVLLYGTILTLGAFYYLEGLVALGAMIVVGLSTLGLYTLFVLLGWTLGLAGIPRRLWGRIRG
ncbi:MAG: ribonuclease BN [Halobacteriales archaeon]